MVMIDERTDSASEGLLREEDHTIETLALGGQDESLAKCVQIGRSCGQAYDVCSGVREKVTKLLGVLPVTVEDQISLPEEESVDRIGEVTSHLHHEATVGVWRDACDVNSSTPKFHKEQHEIGDEPRRPGHFDCEEIGGGKRFPVGLCATGFAYCARRQARCRFP